MISGLLLAALCGAGVYFYITVSDIRRTYASFRQSR